LAQVFLQKYLTFGTFCFPHTFKLNQVIWVHSALKKESCVEQHSKIRESVKFNHKNEKLLSEYKQHFYKHSK